MSIDLEKYGDLLSMADLAELLDVSEQTARSRCNDGVIPCVRISRRIYVPKKVFQEFIDEKLSVSEVG